MMFSINEFLSIVKGRFINFDKNDKYEINGISIDSRSINQGEIYIAIKGKSLDGHAFVDEAFSKGASYAVVSKECSINKRCILVENTTLALANIAKAHLKRINPKVIAITGSNGKTTTKEYLVSLLKLKFKQHEILYTEGNFNNDIGLPLTLFNLQPQHKIAVLEMGMNHMGEIDYLSNIAPPHIAIITNIGEAHIQNFGSQDEIAKAKREILLNTDDRGTFILPLEDAYYDFLVGELKQKIISFGPSKACDIYYHEDHNNLYEFFDKDKLIAGGIKLNARSYAENFCAALAAAKAAGISLDNFNGSNFKLNAIPQRLDFKKTINGHTLIDDTYNSNPTSMKAAIDLLDHQAGHKILVIGDMGELGDKSLLFHRQIGEYILTKNIDLVLAVGVESKNIIGQLGNNAFWFENKIKLIKSLKEKLEANSVILIKGSRFMKMEEVVASLEK